MGSVIHRISIKGFKSLVDVELELPRLAVLAGPNAAGKSNVLDALQMLARAGTERTLAEALTAPIRGFAAEAFTLPPGGLPELLASPTAAFTLEADIELPGRSPRGNGSAVDRVRYRVAIEIDPDAGVLSVSDEYLARLTRGWEQKDNARVERVGAELHVRRSGGGGHPRHEPIGLNHTQLSDARLSGSSYPLFDAVRSELRNWRTYYLDPQAAMRAAAPPRDVPDIGSQGEHLAPFLYGLKTRRPEQFDAVGRALRAIVPAIGRLDVDLDTKRGTLDIQIEQDGTTFSSRIVSEGTLRILGLCTIAVTTTAGVIAFEEPENGVQPQRIERIAELLASTGRRGNAQLILTTHSPEFIAAMLARSRSDQTEVALHSVVRDGRATQVRRMQIPENLFMPQALDDLLSDADPQDKLAALARRGWLDL